MEADVPDPWLRAALSIPVAVLLFKLRAETSVRVSGFCGRKVHGALFARVRRLREQHPDPAMRYLCGRLGELHDRRAVGGGVHERPFVLGVLPGPVKLRRGDNWSLGVALFGETAQCWPAWAEICRELRVGSGRLARSGAWVGRPEGTVESVTEVSAGADIAAPLWQWLPEQETLRGRPVRVKLETPTLLVQRNEPVRRMESLQPVVVAALAGLKAVSGRDAPRDSAFAWHRQARVVPILADRTHASVPCPFSPSRRRRSLEGEFQCGTVSDELLLILQAGSLTHIGQGSAMGFGRYTLSPVAKAGRAPL